jgi:hypothetical protein
MTSSVETRRVETYTTVVKSDLRSELKIGNGESRFEVCKTIRDAEVVHAGYTGPS